MSISDKKFIILQEDDTGYDFNHKKPSGYTKIEPKDSKLKIFYYIQNLDNENTYSLNLIIKNDSKIEILSIGDVKPDETGKVDVSYEFDDSLLDSVCGSALCLKDSKGEIKYPLSGFIAKKKLFNWKVNNLRAVRNRPFRRDVISIEKKKDTQTSIKPFLNKSLDNKDEDHKNDYDFKPVEEEIINNNCSTNKELNDFDYKDESDNELKEYRTYLGEYSLSRSEKIDSLNLTRSSSEEVNYKQYENDVNKEVSNSKNKLKQAKMHLESLKKLIMKDGINIENMINEILPSISKKDKFIEDYNYRFFYNILSEFEELNSLNQINYVFFRVNIDNFTQMQNIRKVDNVKYCVVYYPMLFMYPYFKEKGYFIVGLNFDGDLVSNLVYGIEVDETNNSDLPYDGKTGFNKHIYDYKNSKTYNIMEYDYKNFEIK